ncbi:MAG: DnaJ C-terminal domain-containing protein [Thermodesulfobacteriota bacterium]
MSTAKDYYKTLGLSRTATKDEIKKAYRDLARKYHPDLNHGDSKAEEKFKEIQEAHEVLSNDEKKKNYDMFGSSDFSGGGRPGGGQSYTYTTEDLSGFEDVFKDLFGFGGGGHTRRTSGNSEGVGDIFGFGGGRRQQQKPKDIEHTLTIDFLSAINGGTKDITISSKTPGEKVSKDKITVKIPPGVDNGSKIRVQGKGEQINTERGNLILNVKVTPHPLFKRENDDIYLNLPITIYEALLGAEVDVPTINGSAKLVIPPGMQSGNKLRLKDKGVENIKTKQKGDQFIVLQIVIPETPDENIKKLIKEIGNNFPYNPRKKLSQYL